MEVERSNIGNGACTISSVVEYVKDVERVRAFGLFLKIDQGKLNDIESSDSRLTKLIVEWFAQSADALPSDMDRWEILCRVLLQPAVCEPKTACKLKHYLRRGSSVYSAVSEVTERSVSSPISPSFLYQMSFVGEFNYYFDMLRVL